MFKLLFAYQSFAPPRFEALKKLIEIGLKPYGPVSIQEQPHYSETMISWRLPVLVSTGVKTTSEAIKKSLPHIAGVRLIEAVDLGDSEPTVGGSAGGVGIPAGLPAVGLVPQPLGSDRGGE